MRLPQFSKWNMKQPSWLPLVLSFAVPFLGLMILMLASGYMPFGKHAMLYSDMWHQYYPFFVNFRKAITSGDSLLYNWDLGLGLNYLGLLAYYLASPLNLLCLFLPESLSLHLFTMLPPLKIGLAGLFFGLFLIKVFRKNDLSVPLFASFYALCAWALGYQWNLMWLDGFALLPLVMLGMVQLVREGKFVVYTLALFLAVSINYYVGFFLIIFTVLAFLSYEIAFFPGIKRFFIDTGRIVLFSALAAGMCAVVLLPMADALQATSSSAVNFPQGFELNIVPNGTYPEAVNAWQAYRIAAQNGSSTIWQWFDALFKSIPPLLDGMGTVLGNQNGGVRPSLMDQSSLPNLFCGVLTNVLAFLFLFCRRIRVREKICAVVLLVFFNLSFLVRQLDFMWHGFRFPNSIPYRFSFLYSFVLVCMAYRAWCHRRSFRSWQVLCALLLSLGLITLSRDFEAFKSGLLAGSVDELEWVYPLYNFLLIGVYAVILLLTQVPWARPKSRKDVLLLRQRRKIGGYSLLVVMVLEIALSLVNFNAYVYNTYHSASYSTDFYPKKPQAMSSMLNVIEELENRGDFYRVEVTHTQSLNDSALNGYRGISLFSSSANASTTRFMRLMGLSAMDTWNQYVYKDGSPVTNLFLNLKYLIQREAGNMQSPYLDELHSYDGLRLLRSNAYLPLGFLVDSRLADLELPGPKAQVDHFDFQNKFMQAATGSADTFWNKWQAADLEITSDRVTLTDVSPGSGFCYYAAEASGGSVTYTFTARQDGAFCIDMHLGTAPSFNVYKIPAEETASTWLYTEGYRLTQMLNCGEVKAGDKIQVVVNYGSNESSSMIIRGAVLDDVAFRKAIAQFSQSTMDLNHFENTRVEGKIDCHKDGLLYTSIPQDGHWKVYVDGILTEPKLVGDVMIAIPLTAGNHEILLQYENPSLGTGFTIFLVSAFIFGAICFVKYGLPRMKAKYKKDAL